MPIRPPARPVETPETILCRRCFLWLDPGQFYRNQYRAPWTRGAYSACCKTCTKAERREAYQADPVAAAAVHKRRRHRREARDPAVTAEAALSRLRKRGALPVTFARQRIKRAMPRPRMTFQELLQSRRDARRLRAQQQHAARLARANQERTERQRQAEREQDQERRQYSERVAVALGGRSVDKLSPADCLAVLMALHAERE
jgi:hypothetical protein